MNPKYRLRRKAELAARVEAATGKPLALTAAAKRDIISKTPGVTGFINICSFELQGQ